MADGVADGDDIEMKDMKKSGASHLLQTFAGGSRSWSAKLNEWEPTSLQITAAYGTYAMFYLVTTMGAAMMVQTGVRCGRKEDTGVECPDDKYLCSWMCVMGFSQFLLLQPCLSATFCCVYVFLLIWAGVGAVHLHMYYADHEKCSTAIIDLTWFAVVYSYAHATFLICLVSLLVYVHTKMDSSVGGNYAKVATDDHDQDVDEDIFHDDFSG